MLTDGQIVAQELHNAEMLARVEMFRKRQETEQWKAAERLVETYREKWFGAKANDRKNSK